MFDVPILFIVFNRPDTTKRVFQAIKDIQPKTLFIAADGPRIGNDEDFDKCLQVKKIVTEINWDCDVHTKFREINLGCGKGPADAITWFFNHVERGIILEDDCLPSESFFKFCEELLIKYQTDENVFMISGSNPIKKMSSSTSYVFSRYAGIWGWATWGRAWKHFDYSLINWRDPLLKEKVLDFFKDKVNSNHFINAFEQTVNNKNVSWWDYQWLHARILNDSIGIVPVKNLVQNIGFGENATHTFDSNNQDAKRKAHNLNWPLIHPQMIINQDYDKRAYEYYFENKDSFFKKVRVKVSKVLRISIYKRIFQG